MPFVVGEGVEVALVAESEGVGVIFGGGVVVLAEPVTVICFCAVPLRFVTSKTVNVTL